MHTKDDYFLIVINGGEGIWTLDISIRNTKRCQLSTRLLAIQRTIIIHPHIKLHLKAMKSKKVSQSKFPKAWIQSYNEHKTILFKDFLLYSILLRMRLFLTKFSTLCKEGQHLKCHPSHYGKISLSMRQIHIWTCKALINVLT